MHARSSTDFQLNAICVKPPINHMALALKSTFGRLNGPFNASGATDHDALLQAPELMTVRAEQIFEKADPIVHRFGHLSSQNSECPSSLRLPLS
jgi:hypothetical protein